MLRITTLAGIVTISLSAILVGLADVAPATAGLFRGLYALPGLFIVSKLIRDERGGGRMRLLAVLSGVLLAADVALWHTSIDLIGAGLATVAVNTQVIWVGAAGWLVFRERPSTTALIVIPVVLAGIALIGGLGSEDAFGNDPGLGAVLALAGGVFYAAFLLIFRVATEGEPVAGALYYATIGMSTSFLMGGWLDPGFSVIPTWPAHGWLLVLGLLVHTGGWLLIVRALPRLPALETSVMLLLQPALTIVWASLIFDETMSVTQSIGVFLVLGGILVAASRGTITPAEADARRGS